MTSVMRVSTVAANNKISVSLSYNVIMINVWEMMGAEVRYVHVMSRSQISVILKETARLIQTAALEDGVRLPWGHVETLEEPWGIFVELLRTSA